MTKYTLRAVAGVIFLAVLLARAACDSDYSTRVSDRSRALCADLDSGLTLMNIYGGVRDRYTPEEFAGQLFISVDKACPGYQDDPGVRNMLEGHGYLTPGQPWPDV
jgi:hypothetical protein